MGSEVLSHVLYKARGIFVERILNSTTLALEQQKVTPETCSFILYFEWKDNKVHCTTDEPLCFLWSPLFTFIPTCSKSFLLTWGYHGMGLGTTFISGKSNHYTDRHEWPDLTMHISSPMRKIPILHSSLFTSFLFFPLRRTDLHN